MGKAVKPLTKPGRRGGTIFYAYSWSSSVSLGALYGSKTVDGYINLANVSPGRPKSSPSRLA